VSCGPGVLLAGRAPCGLLASGPRKFAGSSGPRRLLAVLMCYATPHVQKLTGKLARIVVGQTDNSNAQCQSCCAGRIGCVIFIDLVPDRSERVC